MATLRERRNVGGLKLNIKPGKTIAQLWAEYGPELSKSYDIMKYEKAKMQGKIVKIIENVSKGSNKSIDMEGAADGKIYAITSTNAHEIETHMKILIEYLKAPRQFEIPLLYFNDFRYVSTYINFNTDADDRLIAKTSKNSLQYCEAEGKFLIFMIDEVKMIPMDVESYVSTDTRKLAFLDFGEVTPVTTEEKRRDFIKDYINASNLTPDVVHCIVRELL